MTVFTTAWWLAAGQRAAYTALAVLGPLAALLFTGEVTPLYVINVVGLSLLSSLATSLLGIPEVTDRVVPLWRAVVVRVLKTIGQVGAPVFASVLLLEDVGWYELGVTLAGAALATLIRTLMAYLPETAAPLTVEATPLSEIQAQALEDTAAAWRSLGMERVDLGELTHRAALIREEPR